MSFGRFRSVVAACLCAAGVVASVPGTALADPAPADSGVTVVGLPPAVRAMPRAIDLVGQTTSGDLVYGQQDDPARADDWHETLLLRDPSGRTTTLESPVVDVVGDRLVTAVTESDPVSVTGRRVDESTGTTLTTPAGATYLGYTAEGLLVRTGDPGLEAIEVLPWDGTAPQPITGLPAGTDVAPVSSRVGHGSWLMAWGRTGTTAPAVPVLVDTAARRAWPLDDRDDACRWTGSTWSLSADALVWQLTTDSGGRTLCTTRLPAADAAAAPTRSRPADGLAALSPASRLLAVGDDVLVVPAEVRRQGWGVDPMLALRAVGPDGDLRTLAPAGTAAIPTGGGHVVAVTGSEPGRSAIVDLDVAAGAARTLVDVSPVAASDTGVAVDGDRVWTVDDSAYLGGVRVRSVDFGAGRPGTSTLVGTDATGAVTADAGAAAWNRSGAAGTGTIGHRSADGTVTTTTGDAVVGTDDRWVYDARQQLLDVAGSQSHSMYSNASRNAHPAFQDGVTYAAGVTVPGAPAGAVVATDAATRQAAAVDVPGCTTVNAVAVAGSWMLVSCTRADGVGARVVVDRTGAQAPWVLQRTEEVRLGNGFLVARSAAGDLSWTPLTTGVEDWRPLGTAAAPVPATTDHALAVSRGAVPTVAWTGPDGTHAALLPVRTSPLPAHPAGVTPPTAPTVTVVGVDRALQVTWPAAPAGQELTQYTVVATTRAVGARTASATVPGSWDGVRLTALPGLTNGAAYTVTVTAWNLAGWATSTGTTGTPVAPPTAPTDVTVTPDPLSGRVEVSWRYSPAPDAEPARSFTVTAGDATAVVAAGARTATLTVGSRWHGDLTVAADGVAQQGTAAVTVDLPGADTTAPTAGLTGLPAVSFAARPTFTATVADDRRLGGTPVDVRWRTTTLGHRLGAWERPAAWQRRVPGTLTAPPLTDGATACFAVRAHDAAGNVSPWSRPACTATPADDRALTALRGARRLSGDAWFRGTASRLTDGRAALELRGPVAVTGWVLATTCPTCGRLRVTVGGTSYGVIDLRSAERHDRRLLPIPGPRPQTGRLTLSLAGGRRPATIDAVVLQTH